MAATTFKPGNVVLIRPEWQDANEAGVRYVVVEWDGDRLVIEPATWEHGHIVPQQTVKAEMIQMAE
jgi:hypothetical protein